MYVQGFFCGETGEACFFLRLQLHHSYECMQPNSTELGLVEGSVFFSMSTIGGEHITISIGIYPPTPKKSLCLTQPMAKL